MKSNKLLPDFPVTFSSLTITFSETHKRFASQTLHWPISATHKKLVISYWLDIVFPHFAFVVILGILGVVLFTHNFKVFSIAFFPFSVLVFFMLLVTMYWPVYKIEFLPILDVCIENYQRNELRTLQSSKKQQHSVVSLMLIQYVFFELSGLQMPLINTASSELLSKQYGVSVKSVSPAWQLILRAEWNHKSVRKRTEIIDDFETAKEYFRQLNAGKAIKLLDKLQMKVLQ